MFTQIKNIEAVKSDLIAVQGQENNTRKILNARVPEIVAGVLAGDNISIANMVIRVCAGNRKRELFHFLSTFLPFTFDKESMKFLKKDHDKVAKCEQKFTEFLATKQTVFGWLELSLKVEKKEPDYLSRFDSATKSALKHNVAQEELLRHIVKNGVNVATIMALIEELAKIEAGNIEEVDAIELLGKAPVAA